MSKNIFLFHGLEGAPNGSKLLSIANEASKYGYQAHFPDLRSIKNPDKRLDTAREMYADKLANGTNILVGSSLGGYIATCLACEFDVYALFLMAPALYRTGYAIKSYPVQTDRCLIVHGIYDDIVDIETSRTFLKENNGTALLEVQDGHRLLDQIYKLPAMFNLLMAAS